MHATEFASIDHSLAKRITYNKTVRYAWKKAQVACKDVDIYAVFSRTALSPTRRSSQGNSMSCVMMEIDRAPVWDDLALSPSPVVNA